MSFQNFRLPPPVPSNAFAELDTPPHSLSAGPSSSLSPPFAQLQTGAGPARVQSPTAPLSGSGGPVVGAFSSAAGVGDGAGADHGRKGLYGSGDADDRYTLVFASMDAFETWRQGEEGEKMVEFVKGDTHASKAVPPRFKEHTKLVCGRHSRGGRKKYVKKYPDRVRKVPSRKLDGIGCPASISYKTYYDTEEVRACYVSEHSHEIGPANLPFTKRGRKAQAEMEARSAADRTRGRTRKPEPADPDESMSMSPQSISFMDDVHVPGPSSSSSGVGQTVVAPPPLPPPPSQMSVAEPQGVQSAISMLAPLPQMQPSSVDMSQERWDRMGVLFQSVRDHARSFEFPAPSVAALESVLIRLYLESPIGGAIAQPVPQMDGMQGGVGMGGPPMNPNHHGGGT